MRKKLLLALLLSALMFVFAACGSGSNESSEKGEENTGNETSEEQGFLVSEEPIELTFHYHYGNKYVYDEELPVFKAVAEKTNVHLVGTASKNATNSDEVFNLMMASGQIPDIVHRRLDDIKQYGPEGAFIPLNDLIEEHAPNFKAFLDANPNVKKEITATDGNIYAIPFVRDGNTERGWYIRTDWLEKLGLDVPETTEEYYEVLKAFKTQDPNGNGKADEIPYAARSLTYFQDLFYLWGAYDGMYLDKNGEVQYGPIQENYKEAMMNLAQWYDEGLIDQEIFTRGKNTRVELSGTNQLGSTHDWFASTAGVNAIYKDQIEGFAFEAFAPPINTEGERFEESRRDVVGVPGWAISYSNKHPEETMKFFDYFWTEEGRRLMNFGIEGETYTLENGEPVFTEEVLGQEDVADYLKSQYGAQFEIGFQQDFNYELQFMDEYALEGVKLYEENDYFIPEERRMPKPMKLPFTPEEQEEVNSLSTAINTYVEEKLQEWILGGDPAKVEAEWDDFTKMLENLGVEELVELNRAGYQRWLEM